MKLARPFVLLALAALLAPRAEASRTGVWERNPPASLTTTTTAEAGLLASLAPAAAADIEAEEPHRFDLGDIELVERELEHEERFDLGPLTLVDLNLLRGPPPSYPETRVGGFELLPPFRIGASPTLSLWGRQACGFSCREVVSDSRYDPWGLMSGPSFWEGAWSWLLSAAGWNGGTAGPTTQQTREIQSEVPEISADRFSSQPANGAATISSGVRRSSVQAAGVVTAVAVGVATEVAIMHGEGKAIELVAKVGGRVVRRTFRSIKEAWEASREMGVATPQVVERGAGVAGAVRQPTTPNTVARRFSQGGFLHPESNVYVLTKETLAADHIFPKQLIKELPGYAGLSARNQEQVLNYLPNFQGLPTSFNSSKGKRLAAEWTRMKGSPIHPGYQAWLSETQAMLKGELEELVASLSYEQSLKP